MKRVDTLEAFDDLVRAGVSSEVARAQLKILVQSQQIDLNIIKTELDNMMIKINAKFTIIVSLGGAIFIACCLPILERMIK